LGLPLLVLPTVRLVGLASPELPASFAWTPPFPFPDLSEMVELVPDALELVDLFSDVLEMAGLATEPIEC
jgi:hypothetical protein